MDVESLAEGSEQDALVRSEHGLGERKFADFFAQCTLGGKHGPPVDFRDVALLSKFVTEQGKILPRKLT